MKLFLFDLDDTLFDSSGRDMTRDLEIQPFPGVTAILKNLSGRNILVTRGDHTYQHAKIDALGIRDLFHDIHVCATDEDKLSVFARVIDRYSNRNAVVIGNRIDSEIRYGNILGLQTIHIRHGQYAGLKPRDQYEIPHHSINTFAEIAEILSGE